MTFTSVLGDGPATVWPTAGQAVMPACFVDLNLNQVVDAVTAPRAEYDLKPIFYTPVTDAAAVRYRQDLTKDLDGTPLRAALETFAGQLRQIRQSLQQAAELRHRYQRERWFLDGALTYIQAVRQLDEALPSIQITSKGFHDFRNFLATYVSSPAFRSLTNEAQQLQADLEAIRYCLNIHGGRVVVTRYKDQSDYSQEVAATFERFRQGTATDYRVKFYVYAEMNHVEAGVLERVAKLYPATFAELDRFATVRQHFMDPVLTRFDREVQFYLAYLAYIDPIRGAGLELCYPTITAHSTEVSAERTFDIALADKLAGGRPSVVTNDIQLDAPERIVVVSGPNQGGKTTLARTFGQIHYLAALGLPVPGVAVKLSLFDHIYTHFEREESMETLRGKLQDDLLRIHDILDEATGSSIIIMNELFTSTTLQDAIFLGTKIVQQIVELDARCVYVTFVDELSLLGPATASMVSTVEPEHPEERTYKLVKRAADGQAHAVAVADKYDLTYEKLKARLSP